MEPPLERESNPGLAMIGGLAFPIGNGYSKIENETIMETGFQCAGCGEWNQTTVDESAGRIQSYVEDCQVCCKPNILDVRYDSQEQEFVITAQLE
jgi:hypothetical protein